MNKFIDENIEYSYIFTNKQVENMIIEDEKFNQNHTAKMLYSQIEVYKIIIDKILLDNKQFKNVQDMNELQGNT